MHKSIIYIFIDEDPQPVAAVAAPVNFELDTRKLVDGEHVLKIVSKDPTGKEGIRKIPFTVRNGPSIAIEGIKENAIVDGVVPLMVNAYGKGDQKSFLIEGSETPQSIPAWVWILIISFTGWALFYLARYFYMT
ncbi:cytochrome C [Niabella ginsenosidivorans]|uniref:Cytochrome C n=1 Tax=Niabella ginsenosidivorans TaxID=1176587 RepID=A0A1A9I651_9BACT|nr:cytochrome C [Niabella ginsenosidivorans]ANH82014.1 cytochrome C [Niabella ginsenosidivorans]